MICEVVNFNSKLPRGKPTRHSIGTKFQFRGKPRGIKPFGGANKYTIQFGQLYADIIVKSTIPQAVSLPKKLYLRFIFRRVTTVFLFKDFPEVFNTAKTNCKRSLGHRIVFPVN